MRVQLTKEWDGQPAGFVGDFPDDRARAAIGAGAAVPTARVRFVKDATLRGRRFAARQEYDLTQVDAVKAVADQAAEYADEQEAGRFQAAEPAAPTAEPGPEARRTRTPKAEG